MNMTTIQARVVSAAFLAALFLAACEKSVEPKIEAKAPVATVVQPDKMPAPNAPATGPSSRDSIATRPLDDMNKSKESTAMPEAGHGNNHSSPSFKKSASFTPKARRVAWI